MRRCNCSACRARDARRFERIIGASWTERERARLARTILEPCDWTGPAAAPAPVRGGEAGA